MTLNYLFVYCQEFEFKIEAWPIKLSYVPPCFVSSLMYVQLSTPVTTRTSSQMTLAVSEELPCSEELTRSERFLDIVKKIKKVQRKSRRCNIVIGWATFVDKMKNESNLYLSSIISFIAFFYVCGHGFRFPRFDLDVISSFNLPSLGVCSLSDSIISLLLKLTLAQQVVVACNPPGESETFHLINGSEKETKRFTR